MRVEQLTAFFKWLYALIRSSLGKASIVMCMILMMPLVATAQRAQDSPFTFAGYIEPGFPFINTTLNADSLGAMFPERNLAVRCLLLLLGSDMYACFDTDLLRVAAIWQGEGISLVSMPQVSYHKAGNKNNGIPEVLGKAIAATGIYPGWQGAEVRFEDPRPEGPNPDEAGRGPISDTLGRWSGVYVKGDQAVLAYRVLDAEIKEQVSSVSLGDHAGVRRTFSISPHQESLSLMLGSFLASNRVDIEKDRMTIYHADGDTVTVIGQSGSHAAAFKLFGGMHAGMRIGRATSSRELNIVIWKGALSAIDVFDQLMEAPASSIEDEIAGGPAAWPNTVKTRGTLSRKEAAYVVDELTLPIPNPWERNVRVSGLDFFEDGRAAVSTYEGDVWLVTGIDQDLQNLRWKRYASGLSEPMSLNVVGEEIYVFGREGIVKLVDLNGDEEADFYENFSNLPVQTGESREFPLSMHPKPGGGFFLSKGAALNAGPPTNPGIMNGFRAGGPHSGSILEVSADGRSVKVFASGLREPYLTVHPEKGWVTASDQQGNFVPSTPIYLVREGDYYGVPATAHREQTPSITDPLTWVPHQVDRSGTEQVWVLSHSMGPLNGQLVHLSYGKPAAYLIYHNQENGTWQGGIAELPVQFPAPLMKARMNPADGQMYLSGFQVWDSDASQTSGLMRLRYTGGEVPLPVSFKAGKEGVIMRFNQKLNPKFALRLANYSVERWKYERTDAYGSGHFKPSGEPGHEEVRISGLALSEDRRGLFVRVADMQKVMQMSLRYSLLDAAGDSVSNSIYFTMNHLPPLDLQSMGFENERIVSASEDKRRVASAASVINAARGRKVYQQQGCMACHSTDGTTEGRSGPSFKGLYGSERTFTDGTSAVANEAYLKESILNPAAKVVAGKEVEMPSFEGILDAEEIASLVLYIKSLSP